MENNTDLVQQIKQLKNYVILDKSDYEKLVQNNFGEDTVNSLKSNIHTLTMQLERSQAMEEYFKNLYKECKEELKKRYSKWYLF